MLKFKMSGEANQTVYIRPERVVAMEERQPRKPGTPTTRVYIEGGHWFDVEMDAFTLSNQVKDAAARPQVAI